MDTFADELGAMMADVVGVLGSGRTVTIRRYAPGTRNPVTLERTGTFIDITNVPCVRYELDRIRTELTREDFEYVFNSDDVRVADAAIVIRKGDVIVDESIERRVVDVDLRAHGHAQHARTTVELRDTPGGAT